MDAILSRRSIRKYANEPVPDNIVEELIKAAMCAPSAGNQRPWHFLVIRNREKLNRIVDVHIYAQMLRHAPAAIMVCGGPGRPDMEGYWVQDCSAATENMLIAAQYKGLGAVWLGVYPEKERVKDMRDIFNIPEDITPFSIVSIGYPAEIREPADKFDANRIHYEIWE